MNKLDPKTLVALNQAKLDVRNNYLRYSSDNTLEARFGLFEFADEASIKALVNAAFSRGVDLVFSDTDVTVDSVAFEDPSEALDVIKSKPVRNI